MKANPIEKARSLFELIEGLARRADRENTARQADALAAIKLHARQGAEALAGAETLRPCSCQLCQPDSSRPLPQTPAFERRPI